ncbi:hypothetical protein BKA66DRAFT_428189 [Pyrenochaeta sp. MPI-SDFR-AT-0127]|nr:hypothetical protein BKA66DRAFT_428189 [Pyrenochaeta sp. MPI-SDFR-AT-0127]
MFQSIFAVALWKWALAMFLILNLKSLPFFWHLRFFRALWVGIRLHRKAAHRFQPSHIFLPTISTSQAPLMEMDFNLHKSNSTYFTDLDVVRAYHSGVLFGPLFMPELGGRRCNLIVGALACTFKREIKIQRGYDMSTKVVSWDNKWIYMVTHFVERGRSYPGRGLLQTAPVEGKNEALEWIVGGAQYVFASAITRFVCKRGRMTVPPVHALEQCGLLPTTASAFDSDASKNIDSTLPQEIESYRQNNLPIVQLQQGWDKVHELFSEQECVLGRYEDFGWYKGCIQRLVRGFGN